MTKRIVLLSSTLDTHTIGNAANMFDNYHQCIPHNYAGADPCPTCIEKGHIKDPRNLLNLQKLWEQQNEEKDGGKK